jgi:hypothetical protein
VPPRGARAAGARPLAWRAVAPLHARAGRAVAAQSRPLRAAVRQQRCRQPSRAASAAGTRGPGAWAAQWAAPGAMLAPAAAAAAAAREGRHSWCPLKCRCGASEGGCPLQRLARVDARGCWTKCAAAHAARKSTQISRANARTRRPARTPRAQQDSKVKMGTGRGGTGPKSRSKKKFYKKKFLRCGLTRFLVQRARPRADPGPRPLPAPSHAAA